MMEEAPSYFRWIARVIESHVVGDVVEVGCGAGVGTEAIAALPRVTHITAIDVDERAIAKARRRVQNSRVEFAVRDLHALPSACYDSIVCANVLEHIEDDVEALRSIRRTLRSGGTLALLVPAHAFLYSRYDLEAGHFRRYARRPLAQILVRAGFSIDRLFYFNAVGALGWFVSYTFLQRRRVREGQTRFLVRLFDRVFLPIEQRLESLCNPPFGLSLVALCRKGVER